MLLHEPTAEFIRRDYSLWSARLGAAVFGVFGAIALLLSVMGVYSVKAYAVARRTREIGIRLALGARPADILSLILKQGAQQIAFACAVGLLLALLLGRGLTALLFHLSPADPFALGGAIAVLGSAALLACYLPAQRATRVSPLTALRSE
ncbi:MAG: FtsX-like permease family protein [Opitutae bacterium]|nr:FtsX-like permease family protein [Opitutae bacterium]